ncbi:hypothetical protein MB46_03410 [Arthrobacter alpinus]|uniref:hypothetical protein n=1 Tax=Arthrobacter alpinus TaxID=656366 RepID=UPI0005C82A96|nr:hypothetical protein [Arthrobacter alpinus]ALV44699.1 hypothetical protein MB46_03410 [Arthrobacter alpinus]
MHQSTNGSTSTPTTRNSLGIKYTDTSCCGYGHNHDVPVDAAEIMPGLSYWVSPAPVRTALVRDGNTYRFFGYISYWPATGQMHISQRDGALASEIQALFATAASPKQDPETWPVHPCHLERRRISLYRPTDEHYLAEAEAIMFDDLEHTEQADVVASWTEGLANV